MTTDQRLALISVSDKQGITPFAQQLLDLGFKLLSTGGTRSLLADAGLAVTGVSEHTGFKEIMDGRVKTLHPRIHGGILGRDQDQDSMRTLNIPPIELVIVNLYPFEAVTARDQCSLEEAIENIDIGGPAMLRAAAKNHQRVTVVVDPADYAQVAKELTSTGSVAAPTRFKLATTAFAHTARYDGLVAAYLSRRGGTGEPENLFPEYLTPQFRYRQELRYGENPHQAAGFYVESAVEPTGIAAAQQLQGKALSYNNINDADTALECVAQFDAQAACVIVKHANPCGVATGASNTEAYLNAYATDPVSSFGGIIAFNREVQTETAAAILDKQFVEVVLAPRFSDGAINRFASKQNIRILVCDTTVPDAESQHFHGIAGGLLVQQKDRDCVTRKSCKCISDRQPDDQEWQDLLFAWKVARVVKSNAIVYAANGHTLGIGAGQMSRIDSARVANFKAADAGLALQGAAMASDAFFPFRDGIDTAAKAGIKAVIQPGGSMHDPEVIAAANEHGLAMVFTGVRHFRH